MTDVEVARAAAAHFTLCAQLLRGLIHSDSNASIELQGKRTAIAEHLGLEAHAMNMTAADLLARGGG